MQKITLCLDFDCLSFLLFFSYCNCWSVYKINFRKHLYQVYQHFQINQNSFILVSIFYSNIWTLLLHFWLFLLINYFYCITKYLYKGTNNNIFLWNVLVCCIKWCIHFGFIRILHESHEFTFNNIVN